MLTNTLLLYVTQEALSKARDRLAARRQQGRRRQPSRAGLPRRRKTTTRQ